jgi:hypothetical protein
VNGRASSIKPPASSLVALLVALAGCYGGRGDFGPEGADGGPGSADDGGDAADGADDGDGPALGCAGGVPIVSPRPLRRLTPTQYENTMRDLFGDPGFIGSYDATETVIAERGVRQLRDGAELALSRQDAWTAPVFPCDITGPTDDACATSFIDDFGARAFRHPISEEERTWLMGVYGDALAEVGFEDAMEVLASTILQAPEVVYLGEFGEPVEGAPDTTRRLSGHELASRLSYFLWDTSPDATLLAAAADGSITTDEGLEAAVAHLLADPRSDERVQRFIWSWMQLDGGQLHFPLEEAGKSAELFPDYGAPLQDAMRTEFEALVETVMRDEGGSFAQLLTSNRAYVNGPLADLYGVVGGPSAPDEWQWVDLDPGQRAGILTRAAFLTVFAGTSSQSPIRRGTFLLEEVLCVNLGDPPPNVDNTAVDGGDSVDDQGNPVVLSVREAVEARTQGAECQGCHVVINPAGFAFEHYDAIGAWQDIETVSGQSVDASGAISGSDVDGPVTDAVDLSQKLADSATVRECFADRWFADALGGATGELDECAHDRVLETFRETGDVRSLVTAIALSDSFRYINLAQEEE